MLTTESAVGLVTRLLQAVGFPDAPAARTAKVIVWADAMGIGSHGAIRLPYYIRRCLAGGIRVDSPLSETLQLPAVTRLDGRDGMGHWQAWRAAEIAGARASESGIHMVGVSRSSHCGALGAHVWPMLDRGCLGLVLTNGPAAVAAPGSGRPVLSTGPIAVGIPCAQGHIVVDLATTLWARGRISAAARAGDDLPAGVAVDRLGKPTHDPVEALSGSLSAMGGYKGFALGLAFEALTGGLFGDVLSLHVADMFDPSKNGQPQGIAHTVIAIHPNVLGSALAESLDVLVNTITDHGGHVPGAGKVSPDSMPAHQTAVDDPQLESELLELAAELGVDAAG